MMMRKKKTARGNDADDDVKVTVTGGPPTTAHPSVRHFMTSGLAERRQAGLDAIAHLRFVQENFVEQEVVKHGLLQGLSQGELAKALGMSKRDVNRLARFPYMPAGRLKDDRFGAIRDAFLAAVWGSEAETHEAIKRCQEYDAQHFEM